MSSDIYSAQVALLVRIIPEIAREDSFALKGGTAINLFVRDLPRLSVDIDLVYLPIAPRAESLSALHDGFARIAGGLRKRAGVKVIEQNSGDRSEEHTSELQSLMRISYAVFCLKKKKTQKTTHKRLA